MCDGTSDCLFSQNDKEEDEDPRICEQFLKGQTFSAPAVLTNQASSEESKKCESKANCDDGPKGTNRIRSSETNKYPYFP